RSLSESLLNGSSDLQVLWLLMQTSIAISIFFFFSSRRRHTRSKRDWSSDVCSSDLRGKAYSSASAIAPSVSWVIASGSGSGAPRSEERRVGKECIQAALPSILKESQVSAAT